MAFLNPFKMHFRKNPNIPNDRPLSAENILFTFVFSVSNLTGDLVKKYFIGNCISIGEISFEQKMQDFYKNLKGIVCLIGEKTYLQDFDSDRQISYRKNKFPIGF